jgi:hypothetical protein
VCNVVPSDGGSCQYFIMPMTPKVPFPQAPIGEWSAWRTNTASGLFGYRQMQAADLLDLPDFGDGDMSSEQRKEALRQYVVLKRPLTALTIFLGVVALEDFVRDIGARLADCLENQPIFPRASELRPISLIRKHQFARSDKDAFPTFEPSKVNEVFQWALGVEPIPTAEFPKLRDLSIIRHTVAHHAARVRAIDLDRFQYYAVVPDQVLNPPPEFAKEVTDYLYKIGREVEEGLKQHVFQSLLPTLPTGWNTSRPSILIRLIEEFNYFGHLLIAKGPVGYFSPEDADYESRLQESKDAKEELIRRCVADLTKAFPNTGEVLSE